MKIKIKLSLMVIAILIVVITGIAAVLLNRASNITIDLSLRGVKYLVSQQASYWQSSQSLRLTALRVLADIMGGYEEIEPGLRRDRFDSMLLGTLTSQPDLVQIYTIWKPNAVDNMDDFFIERREACTMRKRVSAPGPLHTIEEIYLKYRIILEASNI